MNVCLRQTGTPHALPMLGVVCGLLAVAAPAHAAPIGLDLADAPVLFSGFLEVRYQADADLLTVLGFALSLDDGGEVPMAIAGGGFDLSATITADGQAVGGEIVITGEVAGLGGTTPLLTGNLVDFGFLDDGGDLFEFAYTVTGGALATRDAFGAPGAPFGVIVDANFGTTGFNGSFDDDFDNTNGGEQGIAETAPIPEPASVLLLLFLAVIRRMRVNVAHT